jgi:hypothetical protein
VRGRGGGRADPVGEGRDVAGGERREVGAGEGRLDEGVNLPDPDRPAQPAPQVFGQAADSFQVETVSRLASLHEKLRRQNPRGPEIIATFYPGPRAEKLAAEN